MKKTEKTVEVELAALFVDVLKELNGIKAELKKQRHPENKHLDDFEMDYTPSPFSRVPITTQNEALEQIMMRSGMMSRETWEALAGIQYDAVGDNIEDDSFLEMQEQEDGEFKQSPLASYYERKVERIEVPNVEVKKVDVAPVIEQPIEQQKEKSAPIEQQKAPIEQQK